VQGECECVGRLFGRLLIPTLVFGVDSTPQMGDCVGGRDEAIRDDFSSWTCLFVVGDMGRPLSLTSPGVSRVTSVESHFFRQSPVRW